MGDVNAREVSELLSKIDDPNERNTCAAALSKVAAKAEDDVLEDLAKYAAHFVSWLAAEEPLVRAYTACILANIAFLEPGQQKVLDAGGVAPLVRLLKGKEDTKVTLHSTAAVQNLTYKNTACCSEVLEHGGEKALKKLLQHKKDDVQQFAAGALANLQLYRRKKDDEPSGETAAPKSSMSRKMAKILRRKGGSDASPGGGSSGGGAVAGGSPAHGQRVHEAAVMIQAQYRGLQARKHFEQTQRSQKRKGGGNRYDVFRVGDVRKELAVMQPPSGGMGRGGLGGGLGGGLESRLPALPMDNMRKPMGMGAGARLPARLAPISGAGGSIPHLPGLGPAANPAPPGLPPMPSLPPQGPGRYGSGFNPPPPGLGMLR